jgi:hypothetical protein
VAKDHCAGGFGAAPNVGEYLITARSFDEYRALFALDADTLPEHVLDCPGGAAAFTAQACARGAAAVAVDPAYALSQAELAERVRADLRRGSDWVAGRVDQYVWGFYGSLAEHERIRREAAEAFLADRRAHPDRYIEAELPQLPFANGQFELVLSSHLLFTYSDRLDVGFHVAAVRELLRVCAGQVRIFPLLGQAGTPQDGLVRQVLDALPGVRAEILPTGYEFQRGGNQLLVLSA